MNLSHLPYNPEYLSPNLLLDQRVALFNQRRHPDEMTPAERGQEMTILGTAAVPLILFQLRAAELSGPGASSVDIAYGFQDMILDAVKEPGLVQGQALRQISVAECQPSPMPPLEEMRLFED